MRHLDQTKYSKWRRIFFFPQPEQSKKINLSTEERERERERSSKEKPGTYYLRKPRQNLHSHSAKFWLFFSVSAVLGAGRRWAPRFLTSFLAQSNNEAGARSMATKTGQFQLRPSASAWPLTPRMTISAWPWFPRPSKMSPERRQKLTRSHSDAVFWEADFVSDNGGKWKHRKQLSPCMAPAVTWWERSSPAMLFSVSLWNIHNAKMGSRSMQRVVRAGWVNLKNTHACCIASV